MYTLIQWIGTGVSNIKKDYGVKYFIQMNLFYFVIKGFFLGGMVESMILPLYQLHFGYNEIQYQKVYCLIVDLAWCYKPSVGVFSDIYMVSKNKKKRCVQVLSVVSAIMCILTPLVSDISPRLCTAFLFILSFSGAGMDLLHDASYSEKMIVSPALISKHNIVFYVWGVTLVGAAIGKFTIGIISDYMSPLPFMWIGVIVYASLFSTTTLGYMEEDNSVVKCKDRRYYIPAVSFFVTSTAAFFAIDNMEEFSYLWLMVALMALNLCALKLTTSQKMMTCIIYLVLFTVTIVKFTGAIDFFYTDSCVGTPNFSYAYYVGVVGILKFVFGLFGIYFTSKFTHWRVPNIFRMIVVVSVVISLFEILQVQRVNVALGISDYLFYFAGEAVFGSIIHLVFFVNMFILMTRMLDQERSAIQIALMQSSQNFSLMFSAAVGNWLIKKYDIVDCNFGNLPMLLAYGKMILVIICIPLSRKLLPNILLTTGN